MEQQTKNLSSTENKVCLQPAHPGGLDVYGQMLLLNVVTQCSVYTLLIHPDFLLTYPLAKKIKKYGFFSYSTNEALHLSDDEKEIIISLFKIIQKELISRIDDLSQDVIISQFELLLNYANRFYKRQFITRKTQNNNLLQKLKNCQMIILIMKNH